MQSWGLGVCGGCVEGVWGVCGRGVGGVWKGCVGGCVGGVWKVWAGVWGVCPGLFAGVCKVLGFRVQGFGVWGRSPATVAHAKPGRNST